ncbi:aldo/keto reductase [Arcanobacterium hippocoleae]|uniref:2,5-diketo-D-gluconate reductase A n=1 Tax=Arcanobacterium hippocoleae TaxID=149017 RepID=A0ABU1T412_9ACTO|nr:aldo/keto reductase [Arcanobacterium hippocoleae]MDR6939601.1 2,5-diketo-D-gluconate reductase A [Arcanobacterium hippocoleae]
MIQIPEYTLNTGAKMPALGFGTYQVAPQDATEVVLHALELGYRHIDTAQMYGNEREVGAAIAASGIPREELFITTKLNNCNHEPDAARAAFEQSLTDLGLDYVDLFLMHWPLPMRYDGNFVGTYKVMEEFALDHRAKAIGVSNFEPHHLVQILRECSVVPASNQIERHPYLRNRANAEFCRNQGIRVVAWSPIARGAVLNDPVIQEIAHEYDATAAQIVLAWHLGRGTSAIPKSNSPKRQAENLAAAQIRLTAGEIAKIDALDKGEFGRQGPHPDQMNAI